MDGDVKAEVVRLGGREAAEKALKAPFADSSVVSGKFDEIVFECIILCGMLFSLLQFSHLR